VLTHPFTISAGTCIWQQACKQIVYNVSARALRWYKRWPPTAVLMHHKSRTLQPAPRCATSAKSSTIVCTTLMLELPYHTQLCTLGAISTTAAMAWFYCTTEMHCRVTAHTITNSSVQLAHGVLAYLLPALPTLQLLLLSTLRLSAWC
jgi:hypothetical protein